MASYSSSSSNPNPKMIVLVSSDAETFEVEEAVVNVSQTIKHLIEDNCADKPIPLPNVSSMVLAKVIEFCRRHHSDSDDTNGFYRDTTSDTDLAAFNAEFLKIDLGMLYGLILAANYLEIKSLLDVTCENVANMMKGKSPEEIREIFNIKNDFTPEEEEEVRKENAWAFE